MNIRQIDYGVCSYPAQSSLYLNSLPRLALSIHHSSHHHEHLAH